MVYRMGVFLTFFTLLLSYHQPAQAQLRATNTPVPLQFPTQNIVLTPLDQQEATAFPTFTPTPVGPARLALREGSGEVNIRAEADPSSDIVGVIRVGEELVVTGSYYLWYQVAYDQSRTGVGYVFGELVDIIGERSEIPDLTAVTAVPEEIVQALATTEAQLDLSSIEEEMREIDAPALSLELTEETELEVLPTFTYPPDIIALAPTQAPTEEITEQAAPILTVTGGIAPVVPIIILIGLGFITFLIGLLQR